MACPDRCRRPGARLAVPIAGTVVLAILVQLVELPCASGLPALYTRILTLRHLDPWRCYGYLALGVYLIASLAEIRGRPGRRASQPG